MNQSEREANTHFTSTKHKTSCACLSKLVFVFNYLRLFEKMTHTPVFQPAGECRKAKQTQMQITLNTQLKPLYTR